LKNLDCTRGVNQRDFEDRDRFGKAFEGKRRQGTHAHGVIQLSGDSL
jgi:hypothetical protein